MKDKVELKKLIEEYKESFFEEIIFYSINKKGYVIWVSNGLIFNTYHSRPSRSEKVYDRLMKKYLEEEKDFYHNKKIIYVLGHDDYSTETKNEVYTFLDQYLDNNIKVII